MLQALSIRDIVLIDRLDLELGPGLTAVTGETGAGKSIMLDALGLALGARGDGALVREGAARGSVTASFDLTPGHAIFARLDDADIAADAPLVLRRVQQADGRARAFINDQPVSVQLLREVGAALVEIHGQHDDRALAEPRAHRRMLDAFAGLEDEVTKLGAAWSDWQAKREALDIHRDVLEKSKAEEDYLRHAVDELDSLAPKPGEEESLADLRQLMMNAEKFTGDLDEALDALSGDGMGEARLAAAVRKLERAADKAGGRLDPAIDAIDRALAEIAEARTALAAARASVEYDPKELERSEERLFGLRAAGRKYGVQVDALAEHAQKLRTALGDIEGGEGRLGDLEAAAQAARDSYFSQARALSAGRQKAAMKLDELVIAELPPLKLEKAVFKTLAEQRDDEAAGPAGLDKVEFTIAANPGTAPGPLMKVASGGELARIMLALKVVLAARASAPTLVFDEVDSGVSGATADAIGVRLAALSHDLQVLAVTHSPQVAARADGHLRILKTQDGEAAGDRVVTRVEPLGADDRHEEIARMLAGATVTEEARAAARRLIGKAG